MNSKLTKLSAAAVIAVAVFIVFNLPGPSSTVFADILEPFLTARTATFTMTMAVEGVPTQTLDCVYAEPIRMRQTTRGQNVVVISNLLQGEIVTLNPAANQAVVMKITNMPDDADSSQFNMFGSIRKQIQEVQDTPDDSVVCLGEGQVDGRDVVGYNVQKPAVDLTVWADRKTQLPVEVKIVTGPTTYTMTDIVFDVDLDESLFDLTIPAGYEQAGTLYADASRPTEKDLIEMFCTWAEKMDGQLPSSLDGNAPAVFVRAQQTKLILGGQTPSTEAIMGLQQTVLDMSRGLSFVQELPPASDWQYAGDGVALGDTATRVFWYRPEGAELYRVIYADMTVGELTADEIEGIAQR